MAMTGNEEDTEDLFAVPDLWQASELFEELSRDTSIPRPFFATGLKENLDSGLLQLAPVATNEDGFFKLPSLTSATNKEPESNETSDNAQNLIENTSETEILSDLWMGLEDVAGKAPEHKTWDAFLSQTSATAQPPLVSEAGPDVYDALLTWSMDPLQLKNADIPVVEAKPYFSALLSLAIGQESVFFFSKQEKGHSFAPALSKLRISGYSRHILQGIEKQCLRCGSMFLQLRSFVKSTYAKHTTRCGVALASALEQILKDSQKHVAVHGHNPKSLLALQSTIKSLVAILEPFHRLTAKFRRGYSDEQVLSIVFHEAYSVDHGEEQLREIMREVLRRVSQPWIEFLEEWIGTKREEGIPFSKSNVGETKGFVKVDTETYLDDFGQPVDRVDFFLDDTKIPHFMPQDVAKSMFEAGRNLRFIRSCHPEHPLANPELLTQTQPPKAEWLYDWDSILQLETRVVKYRDSVVRVIQKSRSDSQSPPRLQADPCSPHQNELQFFGVDETLLERRLLDSMKQFDQPLSDTSATDSLSCVVQQRLSGHYLSPSNTSHFAPHWSLLAVLSFGGIAFSQAQIINQESLRLLFSEHDLRSHLRMQRDFHLFGNGMYSSRLSHALFDPELETAERQAGVAHQGGTMGLRLGGRDNWPPASSELRLALMGVLADTFDFEKSFTKTKLGDISRDATTLPGDLSFAVRGLSQEEMDKCMNPDSLEALDFLRLSYKPPDALTPIITPVILTQYDRIFKLLLRILRVLYVSNQLFCDINTRTTRWEDPNNASYRFAREAHHFVSGITSYFLDTGVAIPWQAFEARLDKIQSDLNKPATSSSDEKIESPERLRELHALVLDRIMFALFLKKQQQPLLGLIEEIFSSVLHYAKYSRMQALGKSAKIEEMQAPEELYRIFKKNVQIFITVCRGLTEKVRSSGNRGEDDLGLRQDGIGEDHMVAQLLMKLDMNNYYAKQ